MDPRTRTTRQRVNRFLDEHYLLVLLGPAMLVILVLFVYPVVWVFYRSLWLPPLLPGQGYQFGPYANYRRLVSTPWFARSLRRTAIYATGSLSLSMGGGLLVAVALDRVESRRLRSIYTTIFLIGLAIPVSVLALMWRWILHPSDAGLANMILLDLGLIGAPIPFLQHGTLALAVVTLIDAWVRFPFAMVVFLAGIQSIPERLYEAARIDGATSYQSFRHVTLPYLRPYAVTVAVITTMFAVQAFTVIWNMTGGGPNAATRTLPMYIYEVSILQFNFGHGAAMSTFLIVLAGVLTFVYLRLADPHDAGDR